MTLTAESAGGEEGGKSLWFYSYLPTNMAGGCFDSLLPVFIVLGLGGSVGDVAAVSVAVSFATVPSLIFWGKASDAMKWRKHFVVMGFMGRAIAYTAMGFSVGVSDLLFANILMGLLSSASTPAMSILILESFDKRVWSEKIGLFNRVAGVGNIAGIALGSLWIAFTPGTLGIEVSLRLLFLINALLALVGAWMAFILVREPKEKLCRETFYEHILQIIRWTHSRSKYLPDKIHHFFSWSHLGHLLDPKPQGNGHILWFLAVTFIYNVGAVGFFTITPVLLVGELGMGGEVVFGLALVQALASTFLFKYFGRFSDREDKPRLLFISKVSRAGIFCLYLLAAPLLSIDYNIAIGFLVLIHIVMGITWAIIADTQLPIAVSAGSDGHKGSHAGVFNAAVGLGAIAGGAVGGIAAVTVGYGLSIVICAVLVLASGLILRAKVGRDVGPRVGPALATP